MSRDVQKLRDVILRYIAINNNTACVQHQIFLLQGDPIKYQVRIIDTWLLWIRVVMVCSSDTYCVCMYVIIVCTLGILFSFYWFDWLDTLLSSS